NHGGGLQSSPRLATSQHHTAEPLVQEVQPQCEERVDHRRKPVSMGPFTSTISSKNHRDALGESPVRGEAPGRVDPDHVDVRKFVWTWLAIALAIGLTAWLLPGMDVNGGFFALLLIAAVFGLVNAVIGRILKLLTLPLTLMTLGLFSLVINAFMLLLTDRWLDRLDVDGFVTALLATLLISLFSTIAQMIVLGRKGSRH
ncbi:MAG TPA: phage holin family protein, partial [Ilumatobacteraceae bacterium]